MFDFEKWSEDVYRINDLMEQYKENTSFLSKYESELSKLWDELFNQEDQFVSFLNQLLAVTKEEMNGENQKLELETIVNQMRASVLEE